MQALIDWMARGGPVMIILTALGLVLYALIFERFFALYLTAGRLPAPSVQADASAAALSRRADDPELTRGLGLIRALTAAAPLLGLLGTVNGMITTFDGILLGDKLRFMGAGISQALLTTQYGLAIAIPALVAERLLTRRSERIMQDRERVTASGAAGGWP